MKRPLHPYWHVFLLTLLCLSTTVAANAQLSYTFTASSVAYAANSGGTNIIGSSTDEDISDLTDIGFTFIYNCQAYTNFKASSNGWLCLGNGTNNSFSNNNLASSGNGPFIAPLWDDLATSSSGNVNYKLSGTAPNRILTVEWKAMKWNYNASGAVMSFQAKLYETTNVIDFSYYREAYSVNSGTASIGINSGASNSEYYSLNGTTASPTAQYGSQTSNLSSKPATNQLYRWTPKGSTYVSSTTTQGNTTNISKCNNQSQEIIGVQVVSKLCYTPITLTQLVINMTGSTNPTTNVTGIHIYYTGNIPAFAPANEFNASVITPSASTITVTGTQPLLDGTNYFWVAYDISYANATAGNPLDAQCTSMTVGGTAYTPSVTNPTGSRSILTGCPVSPGGISNANFWVKANTGTSTTTNNSLLSTWEDQSGNTRNATSSGNNRPTYYDNASNNINFNPVVDFDDAAQDKTVADYMDISSNGILSTDNKPYEVYAVIKPGPNNISTPGKFLFAGSAGGNNFNAFDVRSNYSFNDSWNMNDLIIPNKWATNYPVLSTFDFNSTAREMFIAGTSAGTLAGTNRSSPDSYNALGCQRSNLLEFYDGGIAEIVTYANTSHNVLTRHKVESYLAIKYGISLSHNYYSSTGTTIWNTAANALYNNNIIGLARDDNSALSQKQSKSTAQVADILTLYIGSTKYNNQASNSTTFTAGNMSFFMAGHNGAPYLFSGAVAQTPPGVCCRLQRQWLAQVTNFTNTNLVLEFDFSAITPGYTPLNAANLRLLVDDDGNFSNATILTPTITVSGSKVTLTTSAASFTSGRPYFTLASLTLPILLPVNFTSLTGTCSNNSIQVKWSVATAAPNSFIVERSNDKQTFTTAAVVQPNASGELAYKWTDLSPLPGVTYYRIRTKDASQADYYSSIIAVSSCGTSKMMVTTDPLTGESALNIRLQENAAAMISLYDVLGRRFDIPGLTGKHNLQQGTYRMPVNLQQLTAGVYLLSVDMNGSKQVYRVVKQ